ncbi:MAG: hypothetical protein K9N47_21080 [Prosthecobacter sp.]|uniref:hypothetical protein n=1 Tax=Prosthecobacter sp. TaxID=1965333 RepID=UPI002630ECB3|nr:hypothetical protein [Prosthecobacter sp.]MCF7788630.1 hypothetical protein [Prosthecobacter sp.]
MTTITEIQTLLKVPADGTWSPTDQAALLKASAAIKKRIQQGLGVLVDGRWGPKSQGALNGLAFEASGEWIVCEASSFADPADLRSFKKCKATGKSDLKCFAVGDNGVGESGVITAQEHTPYVAIHDRFLLSRWGSRHAAWLRKVEVVANGRQFIAQVGDRISAQGRIDLNPACLLLINKQAPLKIDAKWRWL